LILVDTNICLRAIRFLPNDDPLVDVWISRDLDSVVTYREKAAVDDWLENCITMKELYNISENGKICITSGFCPGIYRLNGQKNGDELIALKMEFIKEQV
jgi:hypothetical protein